MFHHVVLDFWEVGKDENFSAPPSPYTFISANTYWQKKVSYIIGSRQG